MPIDLCCLIFWTKMMTKFLHPKIDICILKSSTFLSSKAFFFFNKKWYFSSFSTKTYIVGYPLDAPRRGGSNEYPQSMFLSRNMKNIRFFFIWKFLLFMIKFSVYLNRHVFVMDLRTQSTPYEYMYWQSMLSWSNKRIFKIWLFVSFQQVVWSTYDLKEWSTGTSNPVI